MISRRSTATHRCVSRLALQSVTSWILFFGLLCQVNAGRWPVYNIAHMVNSVKEVDDYLERGANALEADVTFYRNGSINGVYHGVPCDCFRLCEEREDFVEYIKYLRDIATNPSNRHFRRQLALLFLDLKVSDLPVRSKYTAGEEVARNVLQHLWNVEESQRRLPVLLSIGHTSDSDVFRGVKDYFDRVEKLTLMDELLGFDVGMNDPLHDIGKMYEELEIKKNRWQGDGITNCLNSVTPTNRFRSSVRIRNSSKSFIEKVYRWTIDFTSTIRSSLRDGADGILTNFPERVSSILNEESFRESFRLASIEDNPWERSHQHHSNGLVYRQSNMDSFVSSLREVLVAMMGFIWDVYRFRLQRPMNILNSLNSLLSRSFTVFPG